MTLHVSTPKRAFRISALHSFRRASRFLLVLLSSFSLLTAHANDVTAIASGSWNAPATWVRTLPGTINVNSGTATVTATGVTFQGLVSVDDFIHLADGTLVGKVKLVNANNTLTLYANVSGNKTGAWGKEAVPLPGDDVFINKIFTVTVTADATAASLSVANGTNTSGFSLLEIGAFTLTVTGKVQVDAGSGMGRNSKIVFTGAGTLDVGGDLIVGSAGSSNSTATLDCGTLAANVKVKGNFGRTNTNGSFLPGTSSKVWFTGTAAQTINLLTNFTYADIRVANTGAVTLGAAVTSTNVKGNIEVTSGTLSTNNLNVALASGKNISVSSGATLDAGSSVITLSGAGAATINGTFKTSNVNGLFGSASTAFAASPAISLSGSTIEYSGTGQLVMVNSIAYNNLTFSGGSKNVGTASGQTLNIGGAWVINSAANLAVNNVIVNVSGNVSGTGALTVGTNLITATADWTQSGGISGSANMKFTSAAATSIPAATYSSLEANATKTLAGNVTATTMTLTGSARILLGNANVTVTTLNGSGSGSYFVTNGSGALSRKSVSTGAATVFPVGASITSYTPVSLTPSTLQDWSVRVQAGFSGYPTVNVSSALPRVWHVTPAAGSSTTATDVQLGYDEADLGWNFTSLEIYHYGPPNGWALAQGNTAPGGTSNARTVMVNGQTSFSPFAITKVGSPLPVNFLSFSGKHLTGRNLLSWATAQESDNQGFSVERSTDGRSFAAIGFVQSLDPSGNSSQVLRYGFSDGAIESRAPYFYRLRQQDRTGHSRYSTVIRIDPAGAVSLQIQGLFPNPAVSDIRVAIQSPADLSGRYSIVNAAGVLVKEGPASLGAGANTLPLQVSDLPAGQYFFRLTAAGSTETWSSRFIKN